MPLKNSIDIIKQLSEAPIDLNIKSITVASAQAKVSELVTSAQAKVSELTTDESKYTKHQIDTKLQETRDYIDDQIIDVKQQIEEVDLKINAVSEEIDNNTNQINVIHDQLTTEITNRQSEDERVLNEAKAYADASGGKIDVVKVNNVEQTIEDKTINLVIPTKTSDLINDNSFTTEASLQTEIRRAQSVENTLSQKITTIENDYLTSADKSELSDQIQGEYTRASEAETTLETKITNEVNRATQVEQELQASLNQQTNEINTNLSTTIAEEILRATTTENELIDQVNNIKNDYLTSTDKTQIVNRISTETTNRQSEDERILSEAKNYTDNNGGKIDIVKVNSVVQTISNKTINLAVPTKTSDITNDSDFTTNALLTAETNRAIQKEDGLSQLIDVEEQRAIEVETGLINQITVIEKDYLTSSDKDILVTSINNNTTAINAETNRATQIEADLSTRVSLIENDYLTSTDKTAFNQNLADETARAEQVEQNIIAKIPNEASADNQLADKAFVNSSIATNTAHFRGTFDNVSKFPLTNNTINDYTYVEVIDDVTGLVKRYDRYKWTDENKWSFEYPLNNSSFTSEQWSTINSGITKELVSKIHDMPTIPTKLSNFDDDLGDNPTHTHKQYLTAHQSLDNYYTKAEIDAKISGSIADSIDSLLVEGL